MTKMEDFNINELMLFIVGILGSLGGLCVVIQKSKCKTIKCCGFGCDRDVDAVIKEEKLQLTGHTGDSPAVKNNNNKIKLELKDNKK